jgi:Flp pilus assembly protein TadG
MLRSISRSAAAAWCWRSRSLPAGLLADRQGVSALEFAIAAPVLLTIGTGMLKFGVAMSHYLMLTNAAAQGASTFALTRGTSTPYATTITAINNAAPNLTSGSVTKTLRVNGTACTTDSGCSALLTSGATATVVTTYPCDLSVMGVNFKPSCTLTAQSAQMVQ